MCVWVCWLIFWFVQRVFTKRRSVSLTCFFVAIDGTLFIFILFVNFCSPQREIEKGLDAAVGVTYGRGGGGGDVLYGCGCPRCVVEGFPLGCIAAEGRMSATGGRVW